MDRQPNVLWVSFEDTNPFYGCYGDTVAHTPHVDALAAEGCRWPAAFSTCGVCAPARAAVITGMYAISIGAHHMRTTFGQTDLPELPTPYSVLTPPAVKCFTEYFRAAGYYCSNNAKTDYQFPAPRSAWDDCSHSAHWRNRPHPEQPFFAVFNPTNTHESGQWPENAPELTIRPEDVEVLPTFPDTPKVRTALAQMHSQIEIADRRLGELLAELEEDGLADNTIVVHWSDHGPLPRGKRWPYDSGIHVPMIVRWPGRIEPGTVSETLVSTLDLAPSMLSSCGLPVPCHLQGQPFLGELVVAREYIHASRDRHDTNYDRVRAVRDSRYKYLRNYYPHQPYVGWVPYRNRHPIHEELQRLHLEDALTPEQALLFAPSRPAEELYDTRNDPHETRNLANSANHAATLARLSKECDDWLNEVGDLGEISEWEMVNRWYPNGVPEVGAPLFVALDPSRGGMDQAENGMTLVVPAAIQLHAGMEGASVEYRLGDEPHWRLYAGLIRLNEPGPVTIEARACRIGYKDSPTVTLSLQISA
ncbi:MAG TPA: sulfatase [Lentisphaeria bacterium]|nr:sulfatase [Lentisphaeria bacterium]